MDFQFTAAQCEVRDRARRFAQEELKPQAAIWDEEERFPTATVQRAAKLGFLGLTLPNIYGGSGLGPIEAIITIEEMAKGCANTAEIVFDSLIGPIQVLLHFGSEPLRQKILPKAARGEHFMAIAITEPHAGSGATDMHSRARIEGDTVVLCGHKCFVEDVAAMNSCLVYAKFDDKPGARSIGGVLVEKDQQGFTIGPPRKKMGVRGCMQADLFFDNCRVPRENLIVGPGEFGKLISAFNLERWCGGGCFRGGDCACQATHPVWPAALRLSGSAVEICPYGYAARCRTPAHVSGSHQCRSWLPFDDRGFDGEGICQRDGGIGQ
jgi:butyryl-CoA dehydrogenase